MLSTNIPYYFAILMIIANCQTYNCITGSNNTVAIGDDFILCVHINLLSKRIAFPIKVDLFTALKASNVYAAVGSNNTNITIQAQNMINGTSANYVIVNGSTTYVPTLYSFVINVAAGKIQSIIDDNSANCGMCSGTGQVCMSNNCFQPLDNVTLSNNDPRIFISWIGTDKNGQYMLSQSERISKFTAYSITNIISSARSVFS